MHELLHERGQSRLVEKLGDRVLTIFLYLMHFVVCRATCLSILQLQIQPTPT